MTFHARLEATIVGLLYTVLLVVTSINCAVVNETAVSLGSTIHLPCAVADDANDEANHVIANNQVTCMAWYKKRSPIWKDRTYFASESWSSAKYDLVGAYDLLLNNVSFQDAGEYVCVKTVKILEPDQLCEDEEAVVKSRERNKWSVYVLDRPNCFVKSAGKADKSYVRIGNNVTMDCEMRFAGSARNPPNVTWRSTALPDATLGDQPSKPVDNLAQSQLIITVLQSDKDQE